MKSLFIQLTQNFLPLLAAVFVLGQLCTSPAQAQSADPIAGVWVREGDNLEGFVIEIYRVTEGRYEARTLYAPIFAQLLYNFQIGEKKARSIAARGDGVYMAETLRRDGDGRPSFEAGEFSIVNPDRLIYISDNATGETGDKQNWRRIKSNETLYAYVEHGRGKMAADRERYDEASNAFARAVSLLMKDPAPKKHQNLANDMAWLLATDQRSEVRNPNLAKQLLPALGNWYQHVDTAAAVYAANGDFENALKLQQQAIQEASSEQATEIFLRNCGLNEKNIVLQFGAMEIVFQTRQELVERKRYYEQQRPYLN